MRIRAGDVRHPAVTAAVQLAELGVEGRDWAPGVREGAVKDLALQTVCDRRQHDRWQV
jgi:hypothetical protein